MNEYLNTEKTNLRGCDLGSIFAIVGSAIVVQSIIVHLHALPVRV